MPINNKVNKWFIALLFMTWIFDGSFKDKWTEFKVHKKFLILSVSLYVFYVLSLFYTKNLSFGLFDVGIKFSLFLFPILLISNLNSKNSKRDFSYMLYAFILGCLVISIIDITSAFYRYYYSSSIYEFYYMQLSMFAHPSYISMYLNFSVLILLLKLQIRNYLTKTVIKIFYYLLIIIFIIFIFLLSSKSGIFCLFLILLFNVFYIAFIKKLFVKSFLILIVSSCLIFAFFQMFDKSTQRLKVAYHTVNENRIKTNDNEGTASRLLIWGAALELIKEHAVFGVGIGDIKDELLAKYKENNISYAFEKKLNAHNQYLQTTIATGFIGLILLVLSLLLPAMKAIREKNLIYLMFLFIIGFNFLFESMLEVQAGVVFYAFFNSFLFYSSDNLKSEEIENL